MIAAQEKIHRDGKCAIEKLSSSQFGTELRVLLLINIASSALLRLTTELIVNALNNEEH